MTDEPAEAIKRVEQGAVPEPYTVHIKLDPGPGGRERTAHLQLPGDTDATEAVAILQSVAEGYFMLVRRRNAKPTDRLWKPGKTN